MEIAKLKPLLKLLRAQGVLKYKTQDLELELESIPNQPETVSEDAIPEERELTYEEKLFYSVTEPPRGESDQ